MYSEKYPGAFSSFLAASLEKGGYFSRTLYLGKQRTAELIWSVSVRGALNPQGDRHTLSVTFTEATDYESNVYKGTLLFNSKIGKCMNCEMVEKYDTTNMWDLKTILKFSVLFDGDSISEPDEFWA